MVNIETVCIFAATNKQKSNLQTIKNNNIMTQKEANNILCKKYPEGYIRYIDLGRRSHSNKSVVVTFTEHGKDYRYKGDFETVLITLGCMKPTPIPERTYNLEDNIFFQKNWK